MLPLHGPQFIQRGGGTNLVQKHGLNTESQIAPQMSGAICDTQ